MSSDDGLGEARALAAKKEDLRDKLVSTSKHCTLKDLEDALDAYGFERRTTGDQNKRVWKWRHIVIVMHKPHKKFAKPGAVDSVLAAIDGAEAIRRAGNGQEER
jgi:hypothetical protein